MLYVRNNNFSHPTPLLNNTLYSKPSLRYYSPHLWRLMYLIHSNTVYNALVKRIPNGSSAIPIIFTNYEIFVYSGTKWLSRLVSKWVVGYKTGSLTWNRKRALFKSKQVKKK